MGSVFSSSPSTSWSAKDKRVLITGASLGIGRQLSLEYAKDGAHLALLARNKERLEEVAEECRALGAASVFVYSVDLTKNDEIESATAGAIQDLQHLDVIILNAGRSQGCYFEEIRDISQIDYMLKLNVSGVIITLLKLMPALTKSSTSRIAIVSSDAGVLPIPYRTVYCSSKFAVTGFTNTLRQEMMDTYGTDAPKVTLCCIPPTSGTSLNAGRMDFGALLPPVQFRTDTAQELEPACQNLKDAVAKGVRDFGLSWKVRYLRPIYTAFPAFMDYMIMNKTRKVRQI